MSALTGRRWPLTSLGSVVKFLSGGTPNKSTDNYWNGRIPWVTSGEMTAERIHTTEYALTEEGAVAGSRLVPKGTSFIVVRGMSLAKEFRVSMAMRDMAFNQDVKAVIPCDEFDRTFIYYYLKSQSNPIRDSASEAAHGTKKLDMAVLEQWPIPRVPLDTQKKIAAILCHYDDLIENNKRRITLLENMAEEIYREWFVRFRFPGWQEADFEKGLPANWQTSGMGQIAKFVMGQSPKSEFYNRHGDGLPFHQGVGTFGKRFPANEVYCSVTGREAKVGDVLFSVRAPVGRLNIALEQIVIGRGLAAVRHHRGCQSYLYYLLSTAFSNEDIIGNGAIFNAVGKDELLSFKVLSPPDELVDAFEKLVKPIDEQIAGLIRQNKVLERTKNQLLPRLISGKLSVENLDIQFPPSMQSDESDSADEAAA